MQCVAICDIDPDAINNFQIIGKGQQKPKIYGDHERAYEDMLAEEFGCGSHSN